MKECERTYRYSKKKCLKDAENKRTKFRDAQQKFDRELKNRKRQYHRGELIKIEDCCFSDLNKFWDFIKKLGPQKKTTIPWMVNIDGEFVTNKNLVLGEVEK